MKYILLSIILSIFFLNNSLTKNQFKKDCKPTNDQTIILPGIFNHKPVTKCEGDIFLKTFEIGRAHV